MKLNFITLKVDFEMVQLLILLINLKNCKFSRSGIIYKYCNAHIIYNIKLMNGSI